MPGTLVGILGFAIIMAAVSALVNDKFIEQNNKLIGIGHIMIPFHFPERVLQNINIK